MRLTPAGRQFLSRIEPALAQIRQAEAEVARIDLSRIAELRLGIIDDFDADLTPEFVSGMARQLQGCGFRLATGLSHEIAAMLAEGQLDIGILSSPEGGLPGLAEHPILHDPLILALPAGTALRSDGMPDPAAGLPFLRYDRRQVLGRLIEGVIEARRLVLPNRFELSSNPALLALVAAGTGWTITTALSAVRARRQGWNLDLRPLPAPAVSRTVSLFCADGRMAREAEEIAGTFRRLVHVGMVAPSRTEIDWLGDALRVPDSPA
jgi:DNA-binding transcriptional LysR family regulator